MSLILKCDTCGATTDRLDLSVESDGCSCCGDSRARVNAWDGWSHDQRNDKTECVACADKRIAEGKRIAAEQAATADRWRRVLYGHDATWGEEK